MNLFPEYKIQLRPVRLEMAREIQLTLLSDPVHHPELRRDGETCAQATARIAVEHADALIKELNK